jgi:hypothetical protein
VNAQPDGEAGMVIDQADDPGLEVPRPARRMKKGPLTSMCQSSFGRVRS